MQETDREKGVKEEVIVGDWTVILRWNGRNSENIDK